MTPPPSPLPLTRRRPRLTAGAALVAATAAAAGVALFGGTGDDPSVREQYGGHGGVPAAATGDAARVALDGRWAVAVDPSATGQYRGFQRGRFGGERVRLPYVPNAGHITGATGERSHEGSVAWYRTNFKVPNDGEYALRFESVNHRATVFVDGRRVAEHVGVYLPFEARTPLKAGEEHTLVVRADWRGPEAMKAAGWHRTWFNFGGINREVTIRPLGDAEVANPQVRTRVRGRAAQVDVRARVRNLSQEDAELQLEGTLKRGDDETKVSFPAAAVRAGGFRDVKASVVIDEAKLWAPGSPNLYDLSLKAGDAEWRGRIGLRVIAHDGPRLLLNGKEIKLHGASLHEDVPARGDGLRPVDMDRLIADLKRIGANATRAQHQLSPAFQEKLDEAGILTWVGIGPVDSPGSWTSKTPEAVERAHARVRTTVAQMQTHPSIFAWNLANEVAGQGHPGGQAEYIDDTAREIQRRDPTRLVALDIWGSHPPKFDGPMYKHIDAIGWTNYLGWYEATFATRPELAMLIKTKLAELKNVFPDRVLAVTEFGAEGSRRNATDEPGGLGFQADLLRTHIRTYVSDPGVAGMFVWNLRDFAVAPSFAGGSITEIIPSISILRGLNEKGLNRYDGTPKPAARVVHDEYARLLPR